MIVLELDKRLPKLHTIDRIGENFPNSTANISSVYRYETTP